MSDFDWIPDFGMTVDEEIRVRQAKFGDGYQQRAPDGINPLMQKYDMNFVRSPAVVNAIVAFLRARTGGESFTFTPPGESEVRVVALKWNRARVDFGNDRLSLTLERLYE